MDEIKYNEWCESDWSDECDGTLVKYSYYFNNNNFITYTQTCEEYHPDGDSCVYHIISVLFVIDNEYDYTYEDLYYELYVEWFDNKNCEKELKDSTNKFKTRCIEKWNKLKEDGK